MLVKSSFIGSFILPAEATGLNLNLELARFGGLRLSSSLWHVQFYLVKSVVDINNEIFAAFQFTIVADCDIPGHARFVVAYP